MEERKGKRGSGWESNGGKEGKEVMALKKVLKSKEIRMESRKE